MPFDEGHGNRILTRAMFGSIRLSRDGCEDGIGGKYERARWLTTVGGGVRHEV